MGVIITIPEQKIKYSDVFSLRNLYIMLHQMLTEEGWRGLGGDDDHSDIEVLYSENVYQKGIHRGGKEVWFWWRAFKNWEGKNSGYFRNFLDIDAHVVYLQAFETVHQGKKLNVQKGEIEMFFRARIESDIGEHPWEHHWFLKHLKHIYEHRWIKEEIEKQEKELWRETYRIHHKVKTYLQLRTFGPQVPMFFTPKVGFEG